MNVPSRHDAESELSVGTVKTLFRFPIKSVGGRMIPQAHVDTSGLLGDRRYAFVDLESGNLCNAKNPRKYGSMLACRALYTEEPRPGEPLPVLEVVFPDGSAHRNIGTALDDAMSRYLGRRVRLTATVPEGAKTELVWDEAIPKDVVGDYLTVNADGDDVLTYAPSEGDTFFDLTPLHFLTTSTLEFFQKRHASANFDALRYRPTMLVDTPEAGLVEDGWVGGTLAVGDGLRAKIELHTSRCVMSTLAHASDVPLDRATLRTIVRHNTKVIPGMGRWACAGVYAGVVRPGYVRVGDQVRFQPVADR